MNDILETIRLFGPAFAGSLLVAVACAVLGVHVVGRRIVLIGVALPQVAAAGIGLSFLAEMASWTAPGTLLAFTRRHDLMAVLASVIGAGLLLGRPGARRVPAEVVSGAAYCVAGALSVLFVLNTAQGTEEVRILVAGDILGIHEEVLFALAREILPVLLVLLLCGRRFLFASFDPEMASTLGIRTRLYDLLLFAGLAVVVARGVHATGVLFVFSYLLLPAAAAMQLARSPLGVFGAATGVALLGSASGFVVASLPELDWPVGPTATATAFAIFLGCVAWRRLLDRGAARSGEPATSAASRP
jgi:ABC-type Mn2+/Zn2+ transport system permease subunit